MKKLALFVEGYTELAFAEKFIEDLAGKHNITFQTEFYSSTEKNKRVIRVTKKAIIDNSPKYFVLIRDCRGDKSVKSFIRENCQGIASQGFGKILGIRDVYPEIASKIPELRKHMKHGSPAGTSSRCPRSRT